MYEVRQEFRYRKAGCEAATAAPRSEIDDNGLQDRQTYLWNQRQPVYALKKEKIGNALAQKA